MNSIYFVKIYFPASICIHAVSLLPQAWLGDYVMPTWVIYWALDKGSLAWRKKALQKKVIMKAQ